MFKIKYLSEKNLVFGNRQEEKDPRIGLKYFGPYKHSSESTISDKIRVGIIGDKSTIEKTKQVLELLKEPISSYEPNKWLYLPYPGMSPKTSFNCSIEISPNWQQTILISEIDRILKIIDNNERIGEAAELYFQKIQNIRSEDNLPDVIICSLPKLIEYHCGISERTRGAKTPKPTELQSQLEEFKRNNQKFLTEWGIVPYIKEERRVKGYDFRNCLKGKTMGLKDAIPIQLIKETTLDAVLGYEPSKKTVKQSPATFAWNFSTGLFYKSNGKPWRLAKLREDTCYVGISFFRDKLSSNKDIQTSMAQVFAHTGEGLVLRGTDVYVDEKLKEAHMTAEQSENLLSDVLKKYENIAKRNPVRVVIHKKTLFSEAEVEGFTKAIGNLKKDFVTITTRKQGIRFMRCGSYPVLRGTMISLSEDEHILFTSGYIPRIRTYPGHRIPQPLLIKHKGDSEIIEICDEILGLTKLNWNTTAFSTYNPITIEFSEKVGDILSELKKGSVVQDHYRFYM